LASLRSLVPEELALDAGFGVAARREYGCFVEGELVCAGTLTPFRGLPANIGVLTHPGHRNQGYGTALVSALTREALAESSTAQFRALEENLPALRVARVLGYVEDGHTFEVVLRPASGERLGG
jgi:predicted GNAT family acetyltransferase